MDKFLEKIQKDLDNKILNCVKGESIIKPFKQVYQEVRENRPKKKKISSSFSNKESIYKKVIEEFLKQHPELIKQD